MRVHVHIWLYKCVCVFLWDGVPIRVQERACAYVGVEAEGWHLESSSVTLLHEAGSLVISGFNDMALWVSLPRQSPVSDFPALELPWTPGIYTSSENPNSTSHAGTVTRAPTTEPSPSLSPGS